MTTQERTDGSETDQRKDGFRGRSRPCIDPAGSGRCPIEICPGAYGSLTLRRTGAVMARPPDQEERHDPHLSSRERARGSRPAAGTPTRAILTGDALDFVADLVRDFAGRRDELLERRRERQRRFDAGERPRFLAETKAVREGEWTVAPLPPDLLDRRVEITGPVDRKMIINALNSGASVFMADFEDSNSPTWDNVVDGQQQPAATRCAARSTYTAPETGKQYRLEREDRDAHGAAARLAPAREARPRRRRSRSRRRSSTSASTSSTTRRSSLARGTGPVLLPAEAARATSRRACGTTSSCRAQERARRPARHDQGDRPHRDAARRLRDGRDPLRAARALGRPQLRALGLHLQLHQEAPRTTRRASCPTARRSRWTQPFLRAYAQLLIQTCHRRGVHAMGGMAAQIPIKDDPAANEAALEQGARRQAARGDGRPRRHLGRAPRARAGRARRSSTST